MEAQLREDEVNLVVEKNRKGKELSHCPNGPVDGADLTMLENDPIVSC